MSVETTLAVLIALIPVAAIWALLEWANRAGVRREEVIGRQIALTDAVHRELGAVVAPVVTGSAARGWTVSVRVPLTGERGTGEPLVASADDALDTFERSGLQHLALGRWMISKR